jgi:hypothetical protein
MSTVPHDRFGLGANHPPPDETPAPGRLRLMVHGYVILATIVAGLASPAAGLGIFAIGLVVALIVEYPLDI